MAVRSLLHQCVIDDRRRSVEARPPAPPCLVPRAPIADASEAPAPPLPSAAAVDARSRAAPFCVHARTAPSPAGSVCEECGVVVAPGDDASVGGGVGEKRGGTSTNAWPVAEPAAADAAADATCRAEWDNHVANLRDQAQEVLQNAYRIFARVHRTHRGAALTGARARALVLVALLYSSRRLYGSDRANEEVLLRHFPTPQRLVNGALTQMAAVVTELRPQPRDT